MPRDHRRTLAGAAAASLLLVGGAGVATAATTAAKPQVVRVAANPMGKLAFVQKTLTARAGKVTFVLRNASSVPHDLAIEKMGTKKPLGKTKTISGGRSARLTLTLTKGKYTYYCTVPGHEAAGMKGTLTVT